MSVVLWKRKPTEPDYMEDFAGEYSDKAQAETEMQKLINDGYVVRFSNFDINKKPDFIGAIRRK